VWFCRQATIFEVGDQDHGIVRRTDGDNRFIAAFVAGLEGCT
jgi:hypothetical protein